MIANASTRLIKMSTVSQPDMTQFYRTNRDVGFFRLDSLRESGKPHLPQFILPNVHKKITKDPRNSFAGTYLNANGSDMEVKSVMNTSTFNTYRCLHAIKAHAVQNAANNRNVARDLINVRNDINNQIVPAIVSLQSNEKKMSKQIIANKKRIAQNRKEKRHAKTASDRARWEHQLWVN